MHADLNCLLNGKGNEVTGLIIYYFNHGIIAVGLIRRNRPVVVDMEL